MPEPFFSKKEHFDQLLEKTLAASFDDMGSKSLVYQACEYALSTGGKRFRPLLCYAAGEGAGISSQLIDPWAVALEFVHTYSLIHDDLPSMDDDDFRRGKATTHKKFNEPTALLAGDALLTEAFGVLARDYSENPHHGLKLVGILAKGIGGSGMILGQALDFQFASEGGSVDDLEIIHLKKTGELMSLCLEGVGVLAGLDDMSLESFKSVGQQMGFAFQLKDDLLDAEEQEKQSYIGLLGVDGTQEKLEKVSESMLETLDALLFQPQTLKDLVQYNLTREK